MNDVQQIEKVHAVFDPASSVSLLPVTPAFFATLEAQFPDFNQHLLVSQFSFDTAWSTWEMHPRGDELVLLMAGDAELVFSTSEGEQIHRLHETGEYLVVPRGVWHTARPNGPTKMLFLTPGEGTVNALTPGGAPV